jgi:hypothetical protein
VEDAAMVTLLEHLLMVEAAVEVHGALAMWVVVSAQSALSVVSLIQCFQMP